MSIKPLVYAMTASVVLLAGAIVHNIETKQQQLDVKTVELQSTGLKLKQLQVKYQQLDQQLDQKNANVDELDKKRQQLENEKRDLEAQLQAKAAAKANAQVAVTKAEFGSSAVAASGSVGGDSDKLFIYMRESGNNPGSVNRSSGACGLGQALPCSKMPCSMSDYACQDSFFTSYMAGRYGTWANAKAFWLAHQWW